MTGEAFLATHEGTVRLAAFAGVLGLMLLWEWLAPRRALSEPRRLRWSTNLLIVVVDTLVLRLAFPVLAIAIAGFAHGQGWGLFGWLGLPAWAEIILALIMLDLAIYAQHVASHHWGPLWRVHKVHHADRDIDATTALRFHPIEIALSMVYKMALVVVLGPSAIAVFMFEVLLNASAMFNHGNVRLPQTIDRIIRRVLVTPDMHRVHHSVTPSETHSNFGFCLSVWDRLFGTYRDQPAAGHEEMTIGLPEYQDSGPSRLGWSLLLPFRPPNKGGAP